MSPDALRLELELIGLRLPAVILETNVKMTADELTWPSYSPGIANNLNYYSQYRSVIDGRQYSYLLIDGAAIQLYYKFSGGDLHLVRQCYFPPVYEFDPTVDRFGDYEPTIAELMNVPNSQVQDSEVGEADVHLPLRAKHWSHVRFDYDCRVTSHDKSHLQFSAMRHFRIGSKKVFSPFIFFIEVLKSFYPETYEELRQKAWFIHAVANSRRRASLCLLNDPAFMCVDDAISNDAM